MYMYIYIYIYIYIYNEKLKSINSKLLTVTHTPKKKKSRG